MNLVIVESPTKSKTIAKFLGRQYSVKSSFGHIRDLPEKELGIDVENDFKPKYVIPPKAKEAARELKKSAKKANLIILATDEDREGEAIAWHILHILKSPKSPIKYQRIVFHEITRKAIEQAIKNPRQIDINLVNAQQARRILDRLVGYKLSPFLWKKVVRGLSAGRVQSVAVRLIVDKEREISAFSPQEYWSIEANLKKEKGKDAFVARLIKQNKKAIPKLGVKDKEQADKILAALKDARYRVANIASKETKKYPSPPFTTSTLQQEAIRKLGFSAEQTMRLAQQLYETGLITYHRTDSLNISAEALQSAQEFIAKKFGQKYSEGIKIYKTKSKGAQEAHEAVRPTKAERDPEKIKRPLDKRQLKLYDLIWRRFIASQMASSVVDSTAVDIEAKPDSTNSYIFRATGSVIKFDGFLKIYLSAGQAGPAKTKENTLPKLSENEILELVKLITQQHFTKPPARYTEASLVKTLEEYGIGRPSTYAPIISTIQKRGYVQKDEQKRFVPKEIGFIVIDLLKENFSQIVDVKFTAEMEKELDKIAQGKKNWLEALKEFYQPFHENLTKKYKEVEKKKLEEPTDKICPKCGSPMVIKMGRFGKFYSCLAFPKCKHLEAIVNSTGVKCPECQKGNIVERKTRKGKIFYSCSRYPKCKYALWDKPIDAKCPKCGSLLTEKGNKIKCSNKECGYQREKE